MIDGGMSAKLSLVVGSASQVLMMGVVALQGKSARRNYERRLAASPISVEGSTEKARPVFTVSKHDPDRIREALSWIVRFAIPNPVQLQKRLLRAGLRMGPAGFLGVSITVGLTIGAFSFFLANLPLPLAPVLGAVCGIALPGYCISLAESRRRDRLSRSLPRAAEIMLSKMKQDGDFKEAVKTVAYELPEPISSEFKRLHFALRSGCDHQEALWEMANRANSKEFNFFAVTLSSQVRTGGDLANSLTTLTRVLQEGKTPNVKARSPARASVTKNAIEPPRSSLSRLRLPAESKAAMVVVGWNCART